MTSNLLLSFLKEIESLNEEDYIESFIGYMLSPVITGIKPASTITLKDGRKKFYSFWCQNGKYLLYKYNLEYIVLQETKESVVLLVYDMNNLCEHLKIEKNHRLLCDFGYNTDFQLQKCLNCLKNRVKSVEDFPHESGIFLGIPYEDVMGFINGDECLFKGYWKVYTNDYRHEEIFDLYDKSREIYMLNVLNNRKNKIKDLYARHRQQLYRYVG
ncbi:DUF3793 family protein [Tissierella pigra]|uniref:DUF3793 family protein n=1 Tax=Tissierella pigra TaxID=2607614 RepID=A0A6N7XN36_9FIRM|nr:DUF3793 family protein [Tissierella pigra]MSU03469.1 DUF3793 family protein [Tissierella pigra]